MVDVSMDLVRPAARTSTIENTGVHSWVLETAGSDAFFQCTASASASCVHLRYSQFLFHLHDLENVKFTKLEAWLEAEASADDALAVDLVRLLAADQTDPDATVVITSGPRSAVHMLNTTRSAIPFEFDESEIDAQLMKERGAAAFEEGFSVEVGISAVNATSEAVVKVYSLKVRLFFEFDIEIERVTPVQFDRRAGGEDVVITTRGARSFGGYMCRFGDDLIVPATAAPLMVTGDTMAPTTVATANSTVATPTTTTTTTPTPTTPTPTTAPANTSTNTTTTPTTTNFSPLTASIVCQTPRVPRSGPYALALSLDGGRTFQDIQLLTIGKRIPVPETLPNNAIVVTADMDAESYTVDADSSIDTSTEDDRTTLQLKLGETYTFIADVDCTHPLYLTTGKGGSARNRPPTAVLEDRLDNGAEREQCEGSSFEFTPTKSFPDVMFYQSTLDQDFGGKITLDKSSVGPASSASSLSLGSFVLLTVVVLQTLFIQ